MSCFKKRLEKYERELGSLQQSTLWQTIKERLPQTEIECIHCLGLGSPVTSNIALSQLTLLKLISDHYSCSRVVLCDPVFDDQDLTFLKNDFDYVIGKADPNRAKTFYFLPHFPIDQLEMFINEIKPEYLLSNDLTEYTLKFTDAEYLKRYPTCCRITKLSDPVPLNDQSEFQVVSKKKKRRSKGKPVKNEKLDFELESVYFKKDQFHTKRIPLDEDATTLWSSAFSDLSMMVLPQKKA